MPNDPATTTLTNAQLEKQRIMNDVRDIGRTEGTGKVARIKLIEFLVAESKNGPLSVEDAAEIWKNMMQGSADGQTEVGGPDAKDTAQRTSDIKHFIVLGNNKNLDGVELIDNAKQRMKALRSSGAVKNARLWEMMLTFARQQNKHPETALSDDQIDQLFADKEKRERALADKLWTHRQGLLACNEGEDIPEIYDCCTTLETVVKRLGGTSKQKKEAAAEAKKKAEEAKNNPTPATSGKGKKKGGAAARV